MIQPIDKYLFQEGFDGIHTSSAGLCLGAKLMKVAKERMLVTCSGIHCVPLRLPGSPFGNRDALLSFRVDTLMAHLCACSTWIRWVASTPGLSVAASVTPTKAY